MILYRIRTTEATAAAPPRIVDAHALLHFKAPKSAKACDAADVVDGLVILQNPTLRLAAAAYGVSLGSVARARRLSPAQRGAVKRGERPLILPSAPPAPSVAPAIPPISPMIAEAQYRLARIVEDLGLNTVLDLLAAAEKVAA